MEKKMIVISFTFCDFYETMTHGVKLLNRSQNVVLVDPHAWSSTLDEKLKIRPVMDLSPRSGYPPFSFRIRKLYENTYMGFNTLIGKLFYSFVKDNRQIHFLIEREHFKNARELDIASFLSQLYTYIFEHIDTQKALTKKIIGRITISLVPFDYAKKMSWLKGQKAGYYVGVNPENQNEMIIAFDPEYVQNIMNTRFAEILNPFFVMMESFSDKKDHEKLLQSLVEMDLENKFRVSAVPHFLSVEHPQEINYPTKIDSADAELLALSFVREKLKDGIYSKDQANDIVKKVFSYFEDLIKERLQKFELRNFVEFTYSEFETALISRTYSDIRYLSQKDMKLEYDPLRIIRESEERLIWYAPCCRFLIEEALALNISGKEKISVEEWKTLIALTKKFSEFSSMSDYLWYLSTLSDVLDIKIKVDTQNELIFHPIIKDNPFEKYFEELMKGEKKRSIKEYRGMVSEETKQKMQNRVDEIFSQDKELKELDDNLLKYCGFRILDFGIVLNTMTHLEGKVGNDNLVRMNKDDLVDFLLEKTKLDRKEIISILDFLTLSKESFPEPIPYGKVSTRKNRLTVKPFVTFGNDLIFGMTNLIWCADHISNILLEGKWPYSIETANLPKELRESMARKFEKVSDEFENYVYQSINKFTNLLDKNICKDPHKNDRCMSKIKELCPGEIDVLSVHENSKTVIVWDAKNIEQKFGTREISSDIDEFVSKDGYIKKLKDKEDFVKRNLKEILEYYGIVYSDDWKVKSVFVFSNLSPVQVIVSVRHNSMVWDDIDEYLK